MVDLDTDHLPWTAIRATAIALVAVGTVIVTAAAYFALLYLMWG